MEGRKFLQANALEGAICPCCDELYKVYRWKLNRQMATFLIWLYRGEEFRIYSGHYRDFLKAFPQYHSKHYSRPKYWGLIKPHNETAGIWYLTRLGIQFVRKEIKLPKYQFILNDKVIRVSWEVELISIEDALTFPFDLDEIMNFEL